MVAGMCRTDDLDLPTGLALQWGYVIIVMIRLKDLFGNRNCRECAGQLVGLRCDLSAMYCQELFRNWDGEFFVELWGDSDYLFRLIGRKSVS